MYRLKSEKNGYVLIETATEHVVARSPDKDKVAATRKLYSGGGGFGGWTPQFVLRPSKELTRRV